LVSAALAPQIPSQGAAIWTRPYSHPLLDTVFVTLFSESQDLHSLTINVTY